MSHSNDPFFLLIYTAGDNYIERRTPFRKAHLELAVEFASREQLVLGGALEEPSDGAVLVFQAADAGIVEDFARRDPYVTNGVVKEWRVRKWKVVAGSACPNPILPSQL